MSTPYTSLFIVAAVTMAASPGCSGLIGACTETAPNASVNRSTSSGNGVPVPFASRELTGCWALRVHNRMHWHMLTKHKSKG